MREVTPAWMASTYRQSRRLFQRLFSQSPVQICRTVFAEIAKVVDFANIFSGSDDTRLAWQEFALYRFTRYCELIFLWCFKWAEDVPSGYIYVYAGWRDMTTNTDVQDLLPKLGGVENVPVIPFTGPTNHPNKKTMTNTIPAQLRW